jgi:hypothetical protein
MEERLSIAREFVDKHEYQVTTLVDTMENAFDHEYGLHSPRAQHITRHDATHAFVLLTRGPRPRLDRFAAWPERYFFIEQDEEGVYRCSRVGMPTTEFGYDRDELEGALRSLVCSSRASDPESDSAAQWSCIVKSLVRSLHRSTPH